MGGEKVLKAKLREHRSAIYDLCFQGHQGSSTQTRVHKTN